MNKKNWKHFDALTEKCEENLYGRNKNNACWQEAFLTLKDIVKEGRKNNADFPKTLSELDEATDFEHDVEEFLNDYFDMLKTYEKYEIILRSVDEMLELFEWDAFDIACIYFPKASALTLLNRKQDAVDFCQAWLNDYPDNIFAITAFTYATISRYDSDHNASLDDARKLIEKHIQPDTECTDDNDILFMAASVLYEASGDKKTQKHIDDRLNAYEAHLDEILMSEDDDSWLSF